jgi:long-subunit fatty acid transport protein
MNVHPSFTAMIPLSEKISLHTGIRAFSTIHQRGASIRETSSVPSLNNYAINTTSIIKASYFDVPLVLHYAINRQWSLGGGIQLSEFYRLNIREENQNYNLSNSVITTTTMQYSANAAQLTAPLNLNQKVIIKKTEARLMAEVTLHKSRWLFSAGYYYGIGKNIELKDASGQDNLYRNEYLKAGIEYQLWKNRRQ